MGPAPEFLKLKGSHVLVTGASSGIGLEICRICAAEGSNITMVARNKERLDKAKEIVQKSCLYKDDDCQKIYCISCDVSSSYGEIEHMLNEAIEHNGTIDFLVSNAGVAYPGDLDTVDAELFKKSINTNLLGPCLLCKAAIDRLSNPARIVFLSSQGGQIGIFGFTSYCPAKFGLLGLAQALQMELLERRVHITVAYPPDTDTPGYSIEMQTKPEETKLISESSGLLSANEVAQKILNSAQRGHFNCTFGLNGMLMSIGGNSFCPNYSIVSSLIEVVLATPCKLICKAVIKDLYGKILNFERKKHQ